MNNGYINEEMCKKCGGKCCSLCPGANFPEDFGLPENKEFLIELLKSGNYCIDWWEGSPVDGKEMDRAYFVRPNYKGYKELYHPDWGGKPCTFWNINNGCELKFEDRPHNCRYVEPHPEGFGKCVVHDGSKKEAAIQWLPYNDLLENIEEYL
jgi:Fe-S-cluster containining protein